MRDKRGKKLTRKQKILLAEVAPKLLPCNWLCVEDTSDDPNNAEPHIVIKNKSTGTVRKYFY